MKHLFLFFLVFSSIVTAQKRIEKTYDAQDIHTLVIDSDAIFQIKISAVSTDKITISTIIDGETFESTLLHTKVVDNRLEITTGRTPDYTPFNDKLSAHKVMSIVLDIVVPNSTAVNVKSTLASVEASGNLGDVQCNLGRGGCRLVRFRESATIKTISGAINIISSPAIIEAQSRNGNVVIPEDRTGNAKLTLNSIHGDITVRFLD